MLSDLIYDVSLETFASLVLAESNQQPVLVDFWADWCSPCIILAPVLEKVVTEYASRIKLAKLEVDENENMKLAGQYKVRGFPTVILFYKETELARFSSAQSPQYIKEFIQTHVGEFL